jgi:hypothetical protein
VRLFNSCLLAESGPVHIVVLRVQHINTTQVKHRSHVLILY